ncbi:MAG: PEP/pyruvate-binding domain-containing protein [Deltaproteobacteria bacterium]|nr:PEP/pyruvate-binding domain-containing protein [Deltaproteobacteria bacterium]MDQ3297382.1 PEP/pyruvate-binding domain-containing protein [Myxococcota bacterium]
MTRLALIVIAAFACKGKEAPPPPPKPLVIADAGLAPDAAETAATLIPDTAPALRLWSSRIDDARTFEAYSKEVGGERFAKFVIDLRSDAIYYFDVNVYEVHKDFVFSVLYKKPRTKEAVRIFDRNYTATKPDFLLCYLVHHLEQDLWTFAFWNGDLATPAHVRRAYERMQETFHLGAAVRFRPDSNHQEAVAKLTKDVPFILNDQLYKLSDYQAFNKGTAVGTLRIVGKADTEPTFAAGEIVVLATTLPDITPVAGIISEAFSSPLSHVSLRAKGWRIPNVGLRDAAAMHAHLAGKIVYFEARDAEYVLRAATADEVAAANAKIATRKQIAIPKADLVATDLEFLDTMEDDDARRYGPKASNLGVILNAKLPGFAVPPGFSVPFGHFDAHLRAAGLDKTIAALLADPVFAKDPAVRKRKLEELRAAIEAAPFDPALRTRIEVALAKLPAERGVFVRSSTNAEDLDNFSGAGLHDTRPNVKGLDAVCDAIKFVWSSTWTLRAYEARHHAGIDQSQVYGSVLVQTGIDATAAGVLVTIHPTDPNNEKNYTINAKSGLGMAVVDGRKVPESLIVSWYNHGIRVLSRSDEDTRLVFDERGGVREIPNPNKGKPVLTNKMAIRLADVARRLTKLFKNNRLDIEWLFAGDQLYIVQTRPLE